MALKANIVELQKFISWIKTKYLPAWKYNSQLLIQQLSSFDKIKTNVNDFKIITERNIRKFESVLAELDKIIAVALNDSTQENLEAINSVFDKLTGLMQLQIKETIALKAAASYKGVAVVEIFEQNSKLYKQFNDYFNVICTSIFKKLASRWTVLGIIKYGRKYVDLFLGKPKIRRTIQVDGKTVNIVVFYDKDFSLVKTKIKFFDFSGTTKGMIRFICTNSLKHSPPDAYVQKYKSDLAKSNSVILEEFAHMIMENITAVIKNNQYLIKAQNVNINVRLCCDTFPNSLARFNEAVSSFNNLQLTINIPAFILFYVHNLDLKNNPVNLLIQGDVPNPYSTLSHELSHAFDFVNLCYSPVHFQETAQLLGKDFTIQSYMCVAFLEQLRGEGFATFSQYLLKDTGAPNRVSLLSKFMIIPPYKSMLEKLKNGFADLIALKPDKVNNFYKGTIMGKSYDFGVLACIILLIDFLVRAKKDIVLIDKETYAELENKMGLLSYKEQYSDLVALSLPALLKKAGLKSLDVLSIGKFLAEDKVIYVAKPDLRTAKQLITKISLMNFIEFFAAYEKACSNLNIHKELRLSAIDELKKAQEVSVKINAKLMKQEGFLR